MALKRQVKGAPQYSGKYLHAVDDSHRVMLPARWRTPGAPATFVVVQWPVGYDTHLLVLTQDRWQQMYDKLVALPLSNPENASVIRRIGATHHHVQLDAAGRLPIPEGLAREVGIESEVQLSGLLDRYELWCPQRYRMREEEDKRIAARAFEQLGV